MRKELDEKMCQEFPEIFTERGLTMDKTAMCWGFQHEDGWYEIVHDLCSQLDLVRKTTGIVVVATTVKEKYGTLRFYTREEVDPSMPALPDDKAKVWLDIIHGIISYAEARTACTCEVCGEYGELMAKGTWVQTLCEDHAKEKGFTERAADAWRKQDQEREKAQGQVKVDPETVVGKTPKDSDGL